jgi:hypothetical protein
MVGRPADLWKVVVVVVMRRESVARERGRESKNKKARVRHVIFFGLLLFGGLNMTHAWNLSNFTSSFK